MSSTQAQKAPTQKQSLIGKQPVPVAQGVQVQIKDGEIRIKGPKGELVRKIRPEVKVEQKEGVLHVSPQPGSGTEGTKFQGTTRALLSSMVDGAAKGYKKSMDFRGVGYRAEFKNGELKMTVGLSHQPVLKVPKQVAVQVETIDEAGTKFPRVHLESADKELLGRIAAQIRSVRPPEPYNGKGVRYTGEKVREKAGKAGKAAAGAAGAK